MAERKRAQITGCILNATMERSFVGLATALVRGRLGNFTASIDDGPTAGLCLHKFIL